MSPNTLSRHLRLIAKSIDESSTPSRAAVVLHLQRLLVAVDTPGLDLKAQRELEKKTTETLEKTQDELGKKMEDLVKQGVSGEDITKAVGDVEKDFKELERKNRMNT